MAEEKYKVFATNPTLDSLRECLINNKVIEVPRIDDTGKVLEKQCDLFYSEQIGDENSEIEVATSKVWMRFFIPVAYLNNGFLEKLWKDCPNECVEGAIPHCYRDALTVFKEQVKEFIEVEKRSFSKAMNDRLTGSDFASYRLCEQTGTQEYRQEELGKIFDDPNFVEKVKKYFFDEDFSANAKQMDKVAILVLLALLNLRCREDVLDEEVSPMCNLIQYLENDYVQIIPIFPDDRAEKDIGWDSVCNLDNDQERSREHVKEDNEDTFRGRNEIEEGRNMKKNSDYFFINPHGLTKK